MPISLVTGLPGHGKTLFTLNWVKEWAASKAEADSAGNPRPVYYCNITGLRLDWTKIEVEDWRTLPPRAILVVDEAQYKFPLRGRGEPPEWIADLTRHRHWGIDIVLITQDPMLLDSFVRRLVDSHRHIVRRWGTEAAAIFEWRGGVQTNTARRGPPAVRSEWVYPKKAFDWYESAEAHTIKRRLPARFWWFLSILVGLPLLVGVIFWRLQPGQVAARVSGVAAGASASGGGSAPSAGFGASPGGPAGGPGGPASVMSSADWLAAYQPRVPGLPHTAPAYDQVTAPAEAPYPAACVMSSRSRRCLCYTQQGTKLATGDDLCRQIAEGGFFVPWARQVAAAVPAAPPASFAAPGGLSVASLGGRR